MTDPMLPALLAVPLLAFVTFLLMAQVFPGIVYRRIAAVLAVVPAAVWAGFGLISNRVGLILALSLALALTVAGLAWLAGWIVHRRKS
ncbi:MAG: hypothetical protein AAGB10_08020 [Pseudomonadota bacterium]